MQPLSSPDILRIWERGLFRTSVQRALGILAAIGDADADALRALPIGARDERLLALREATFGPELRARTTCTACGERMEIAFAVADVRRDGGSDDSCAAPAPERPVRALTSADLEAAAACRDAASARRLLARRAVEHDGETAPVAELNEDEVTAIALAIERADPGMARSIEAACPACGAAHEYELDVADYVWTEIESEAMRLLRDVHVLARGYGWTETEVLALSPIRRRAYRELLQ